ncbi:MAG: 16S rRNA (cytosine(1402)-N(4))-methyltransferase [Longimicrobiales bacterium]
MASYHVPVLLREVLAYLGPEKGGLFFDGTLGGGSHAEAILSASGESRLIAVDRDGEAIAVASRRLERFGTRVQLVHGNYADAAESVREPLAGALLDLGISSHQIDEGERGFSFRSGTPLDMRMDRGSRSASYTTGSGGNPVVDLRSPIQRTAAQLLNELGQAELADIFYEYGEERRSRRLAAEVVRTRGHAPLQTSDDLVDVMQRALGKRLDVQDKARIFQALRMAVNDEMDALERALPVLRERLAGTGVLVVLAYHSLEDRRVKTAFREWSQACICPPGLPVCQCRGRALGETLTRKAVQASAEEVAGNPRARSVRLRAWRKAA